MEKLRSGWLLTLVLMAAWLVGGAAGCTFKNLPESSETTRPLFVNDIVASNVSFSPADIIIAAGTSITWTNTDKIAYFIVDNGQSFAFNLPAESSFIMTFSDIGEYHYHCANHPYMQGTITVINGIRCDLLDKAVIPLP